MEDTKEVVIKSTAEGLKRFMEGTVWEDMLREMKIWNDQVGAHYDGCTTLEELKLIQGRREAIAYCMQLPQMLLEMKKDIDNLEEADASDNDGEL